jgi:hypothetical protein
MHIDGKAFLITGARLVRARLENPMLNARPFAPLPDDQE